MTGSDDSHSNTRPISVAELLAKNGSIGAPPVGGRRRRRRGNTDAVTVAELTGEIPIIRPDDPDPRVSATTAAAEKAEAADTDAVPSTGGTDDDDAVSSELAAEGAGGADAVPDDAEAPEQDTEVPEVPEQATEVSEEDAEAPEVPEQDAEAPEVPEQATDGPEQDARASEQGSEDVVAETSASDDVDDDYADAVAEYAAHLERRDDPEAVVPAAPSRRFGFGRQAGKKSKKSKESRKSKKSKESKESRKPEEHAVADAEQMNPDPVEDTDQTDRLDTPLDPAAPPDIEDVDVAGDVENATDTADEAAIDIGDQAATDTEDEAVASTDMAAASTEELPSYLRSTQEPLFGGQTVADDLSRSGTLPASGDVYLSEMEDLADEEESAEYAEPGRMSSLVNALWIVGQSIIAVLFGAGLFVAFDQLWRWNNIVALVLSVLVILGLVVAVRVVRKTEDIGSTLIAVAVGALVTLGPLALLQSG